MKKRDIFFGGKRVFFFLILFLSSAVTALAGQASFDVAVYGATPSGIAAAVGAARAGAKVVLINPDSEVGGMIAGGLSRADANNPAYVKGFAREFFSRAAALSPSQTRVKGRPFDTEPKFAKAVFLEYIKENGIELIGRARVVSAKKDGTKIASIILDDAGKREVFAKCFIDASYEGDLMARAGVSYSVGREGREVYGESLAGVRENPPRAYVAEDFVEPCPCVGGTFKAHYLHDTRFGAELSPFDDGGKLLKGIVPPLSEPYGSGDALVQAYNFRITATRRADLKVPWPKPDDYDPSRYALLLRYILAHPGMAFEKLVHPGILPSGKFDLNSNGPFSTDYVGGNRAYPEADYTLREAIKRDHENYTKGFFWFLANDPSVPEKIRRGAAEWGLCSDEFVGNGNFPTALYVREARRMKGAFVMTQEHVQSGFESSRAVAKGSFAIDCHPVRRFACALPEGGFCVREEGHILAPSKPYDIPFEAILPRRGECSNLLVSVCFSASHVAYCSMRMEPVYMALGEAAGAAAALYSSGGYKCMGDVNLTEVLSLVGREFQRIPLDQQQ